MLNIDDPNSKDYIRKIKIAIWKSLIMRKNGPVVTIFEAFLPVFIYLLLFLYTSGNFKENFVNKTTIYKPNYLGIPAKFYLLYSPNFSHVEEFMDSVTQSMRSATVISFSNENEMKRHVKALQDNSSLHTIICVVFNDYYNESNKLSYRISTINRRLGMGAAFQGDPPYVSVWAQDYIRSGFVGLQKTIDFVFIEKKTSNKVSKYMNIKLERMPSPPHKIEKKMKNFSLKSFLYVVPFIILFLRTLPFMMNEKSTGIRQLMFSMGLEKWQYWLEWFLYTFFAYIINITLLTIMLTINIVKQVPTFLENSNPVIIWFFLFCFYICNVAVVFFADAVFKTYRYAQIVLGLWFFFPYAASLFSPEFIPIYISIFLMFIPIFTVVIGGCTLNGMETIGGVHFSNLFKKTNESSNMPSIGVILVMFILDAIIYFSLAWYVSYVFPGAYGIPKKWNYFLQKSFWTAKGIDAEADETEVSEFEKKPEIEAVKGLSVGIMIRNLRKKYQYKYAVDGLNIDVYSKQITVLLGHNGAGKTTTIGLITGMIPATSGTIAIDGYNINTNANIYRKSVGLCLQSNAEIPYLTVLAHLIYFAMLRGCTIAQAKQDSLQFLEMSNLSDKADTVPKNLSGGMRRKLSIGMAMVGNSKVVLLDEPTSGLDPEARRDLWDFLLATRGEKTILITTHYMEEADVLGDRIAIMYNGQLICYGTPLFLKNLYS